MKGYFFSGGATKFVALIGAFKRLLQLKKKPDLVGGVSAGAILCWLFIHDNIDAGIKVGLRMKLKTIFSSSPFNNKGGLTLAAIARLVGGLIVPNRWNYLGKMGNLEKLLRQYGSHESFRRYVENPNSPDAYVVAVNARTSARKGWNLKELSYEKAIKAIMASSTIAGVAPAVEIDGEYYYDGGHRDHSPGPWILKYASKGLDEVVSVYTRPDDYKLPEKNEWRKNLIALYMNFVIPTYNIEVSKNDEYVEQKECYEKEIDLEQIFIKPFAKWIFDVSPASLLRGYQYGQDAVTKQYIR